MIRRLVDATIERSLNDRDLAWLRAMLDDGFAGYGKLTNAGLTRELQLRGLLQFDDPEPDEEFDDDPDIEDDELDEAVRCVMLSGMVVVEALDAGESGSLTGTPLQHAGKIVK